MNVPKVMRCIAKIEIRYAKVMLRDRMCEITHVLKVMRCIAKIKILHFKHELFKQLHQNNEIQFLQYTASL